MGGSSSGSGDPYREEDFKSLEIVRLRRTTFAAVGLAIGALLAVIAVAVMLTRNETTCEARCSALGYEVREIRASLHGSQVECICLPHE